MNIIQDFIPAGRKNRPGRVSPMLYVTVHETGNTSKGAGARNHANYLKGDAAANAPDCPKIGTFDNAKTIRGQIVRKMEIFATIDTAVVGAASLSSVR